ncbi:MAG: hypothetical protein KatS3mg121_0732 [Gammaproteobacteria bacterium]|nr:MAG: hypothetical protein KatS3mg121_0732 [Gammaproteobacteria bacterium]
MQGLEAVYPVYAGLAADTLLGRLHAACGRPEAAARHLRRALAQAPAAALRGELQRLLARLANET